MSKLYGDEECYIVKLKRGTVKRNKQAEKSPKKIISPYTSIRTTITDLISYREPDGSVLKGSVYPSVLNLHALSHDQLIQQASTVMTKENPEGRPPPGEHACTMKSLMNQLDLELAKKEEVVTYASATNPNKKKTQASPKAPSSDEKSVDTFCHNYKKILYRWMEALGR